MLEKALAGKEYLLGREFSAADIMMGYTLLSARAFGVLTDRHLNVSAYRARLEVRPALQRRCRRRERERVREAPSGSRGTSPITFEAPDLPQDVVALVDAHLLDLGGTYGDPETGDPIQHDELRIEHDQGDVEIVVYNRLVLLFTTDDEAVRRIHQVCCRLESQG